MTKREAITLLQYHSMTHPDTQHPKMEVGFLGMLRPFKGELIEENFHEVMEAIRFLADHLRERRLIDRELISALWGICYLARLWGIDADGMLRGNNLISDSQVAKLTKWIDCISWTITMLLDGQDDATAFELYEGGGKKKTDAT